MKYQGLFIYIKPNNMKYILRQKIKNHPLLPDVVREIVVRNFIFQPEFEQIKLDANIMYFKDGKNISSAFNSEIKDWWIKNNTYTTVRDSNGEPILNPNYDENEEESNENSKYIMSPSFDYFYSILVNPVSPPLINILRLHIYHNDDINFFDELLGI